MIVVSWHTLAFENEIIFFFCGFVLLGEHTTYFPDAEFYNKNKFILLSKPKNKNISKVKEKKILFFFF